MRNENDKEISKDVYIYILYIHPEEREKVIDDFSLI